MTDIDLPISTLSDPETEALFARVTTGNPQADEILGGGFPANSINVIMGQPGTGKTVFAEQLLFHNVASDNRPLLYLTTLSEPMTKVVTYAQRFGFFTLDDVGTRIIYDDLGPDLLTKGPGTLVPRVLEAIKTMSPRIIVIDSFKAIHDLMTSTADVRRLVSELAGVLSAYNVTAFLLGEYTQENIEAYPEFAVADSIIQLERHILGARDERFLRILKLRGSAYREGQHAFRITSRGLEIFPRLITPNFESYYPLLERTSTGIPGFDALVEGGTWRGSTTLLIGPTGSGKTTLGLQFIIEGIRQNEPVLYVNFQENPAQVKRVLRGLGADPEDAFNRGFYHLYRSPVELQIDSVIVEIFELIHTKGIRRVVIDAVGDLANAANDTQRLHDYLYSLVQHFVVRNVTSFITLESVSAIMGITHHEQQLSYMCDNVVLLAPAHEDRGTRTLRVVKTRNSGHDPRSHEFEIRAGGAHVR